VSRLQVPVHAGCMDPSALIRQARHAAGLTQRELARRAGVTRAALSHYERRRRIPTIATLEAVLAGAGQQVRAELEQLNADVERAIAALADQTMADRDGVFGWGQVHPRRGGLASGGGAGGRIRKTDGSGFGRASPTPRCGSLLRRSSRDTCGSSHRTARSRSSRCTRSTPPITTRPHAAGHAPAPGACRRLGRGRRGWSVTRAVVVT
jgi:transcriptional regulator with XRE-family HTH domain